MMNLNIAEIPDAISLRLFHATPLGVVMMVTYNLAFSDQAAAVDETTICTASDGLFYRRA
jgi:hypothetical protein